MPAPPPISVHVSVMGNDGGSIPTRGELVTLKKKEAKIGKQNKMAVRWFHCAMSSAKLKEPIVACMLGNLFNKEAVLMHLLARQKEPDQVNDAFSYIKSMKDVVTLKLTRSESSSSTEAAANTKETSMDLQSPYCCPVLEGVPMNGRYRFSFVKSSGHVFSEKAIKEMGGACIESTGLPEASIDFGTDLIPINGTNDEVDRLKVALTEEQQRRLAKKRKKKAAKDGDKNENADKPTGGEARKKRQKTAATAATAAISVADDPGASEAFKSLFTSSVDKTKTQGETFCTRGTSRM